MAVFKDFTPVTLRADAESDPELAARWAGTVVLLPPGFDLPERGDFCGIPGWRRQVPDLEWVIGGGAVDLVAAFVDTIPGRAWRDPAARAGYIQTARDLLAAGVTEASVRERLPQLYAWAVADHTRAEGSR